MQTSRVARGRTVNRVAPEHLGQWNAYYKKVFKLYAEGAISRADVHNALVSLGYRDQALQVELSEFDRARAKFGGGSGA